MARGNVEPGLSPALRLFQQRGDRFRMCSPRD